MGLKDVVKHDLDYLPPGRNQTKVGLKVGIPDMGADGTHRRNQTKVGLKAQITDFERNLGIRRKKSDQGGIESHYLKVLSSDLL